MNKQKEKQLRSQLAAQGFGLTKSRKPIGIDNLGGYMLTNLKTNAVVEGSRFELNLEDVENYLINI